MEQQMVVPYLLYEDVAGALEWLSKAFGFRETMRMDAPGYVNHAEMETLQGGRIFMGDPGGDFRGPKSAGALTALMYIYVDDVDAQFARAKEAGAAVVEEPADQVYGEHRCAVEDPEGHQWFFAAPIEQPAPEDRSVGAHA